MKPKTADPKKVKEPRVDCRTTNYSETALRMFEEATGQRFARATPPAPRAPAAQAADD